MARPRKVHTLENLLERTEEVGECRVWTGYSANKTPQVDHQGKMVSVRRLILQLQGDQIKGKFLGVSCHTELCVCPDHITQRSASTHAKAMAKGAAKKKASKITSQVVARRKRADIKLDMEKAREIRESHESGPVLAARYGVCKEMVSRIKRGVSWRDHSNPFASLFAANDSKRRAA